MEDRPVFWTTGLIEAVLNQHKAPGRVRRAYDQIHLTKSSLTFCGAHWGCLKCYSSINGCKFGGMLLPPFSLNFRNARIDCLSTLSLMDMDWTLLSPNKDDVAFSPHRAGNSGQVSGSSTLLQVTIASYSLPADTLNISYTQHMWRLICQHSVL